MINLDKLRGIKKKTIESRVVVSPEYIITTKDSFDNKRKKECVNVQVLRINDGSIVLSIKTNRYGKIQNILDREKKYYGTGITKIVDESTYDKK